MKQSKSWKIWICLLLAITGLLNLTVSGVRADDFWGPWPIGDSPEAVGKLLLENYLNRIPEPKGAGQDATTQPVAVPKRAGYPEACMVYGSLRFSAAIGDQAAIDKIVNWYSALLTPAVRTIMPNPKNEDASVSGIIPLQIYIQTGDKGYLPVGLKPADNEWANPLPSGLSPQTRFWIDDMFMITSLQLEAYRATHEQKYLDRAAQEMSAYIDKLQQPNGLFFHGEYGHVFWGRGNGWMAAGMTEMLLTMPEDYPSRPKILAAYKKMMAGLLKYQTPDGMWLQLIDNHPSFADLPDWPESSCTAMFTFAMAVGVRHGWIDAATYKDAVKKGWIALCGNIDAKGNLEHICVGTNQNANPKYYLQRQQETGNEHGQAAAIWAAWALLN
ncbi:MAG TPA: glycoside hydrolase family 88 protein [Phycisphaerae bacterium]|nr:glycoside hydrolase family 88 protein [Phycisphaerae bacterium]